ncbi:hypothetical protein Vadar_031205 [Vaccinium darrowii]|uniref:Uncharacterized protein n=1 Tax=Vaccinium darrowii TaxID=229202 RepID=A0ACB7ZFP2_9ERIC|nr:hypothetical protein Vadar_031205 [Vaccinium darrowii]
MVRLYSNPDYFTIKLNHGGNLVKEDMVEYYVGGSVNYIDYCNNDRISKTELHAMSKEVGCVGEVSFYWRFNGLDGNWVFKKVQVDGDVTSIVQNLTNQLVELYIVDINLEGPITVDVEDGLEVVDWGDGLEEVDVNSWEWDSEALSQANYTIVDLATQAPSTSQNQAPITKRSKFDNDSDSDPEVFIDSDYDLSDDDVLFDANVDKDIEWTGVSQKKNVGSDLLDDCFHESDSEEENSSDGLRSLDSSSDEDIRKRPKFREYRPVIGKQEPIIEEEMIFKNRAQCVEAIRQHAILNGKEITFEKNESDRVRAKCAHPCPWKILVSNITSDRKTLQVKTLNPIHKCGWIWTNKLLNSSWLAKTYLKEFRIKPSWPINEIVEQVMGDFNVKISVGMAYNARKKALKKMEGSYAVRNDEELSKLLEDVTIVNGGGMPNIPQPLAPEEDRRLVKAFC